MTLKGELAHRASLISISLSGQPSLCDNAQTVHPFELPAQDRANLDIPTHEQEEPPAMKVSTVGLDLAKNVFQVHAIDEAGGRCHIN